MKQNRSFVVLVFFVILGAGAVLAYARHGIGANAEAVGIGVDGLALGFIVSSVIQVADRWDKAVNQLRLPNRPERCDRQNDVFGYNSRQRNSQLH